MYYLMLLADKATLSVMFKDTPMTRSTENVVDITETEWKGRFYWIMA